MKIFSMLMFFILLSPLYAFAETPASTIPVQFPDQRLTGQLPGQPIDPFINIESQQMMHETLMALRDIVNVMREIPSTPAPQKERLDDLSERLDFLITRQQDLAMRQRLGR
ncbi:MAG: hypothetical protein A2054_06600 [Deltaproteobacteria bacterium GWA2_55_10]|nr:MAG: hypothetical protein A2054_06600 [Deltaproteobacteria bacterium GWA2_55_10]